MRLFKRHIADPSPQLVSAVAISQEADDTNSVEADERSTKKPKPNMKDESEAMAVVKEGVDAESESTSSSLQARRGRNNNINDDVSYQ